MMLKDKVAVIYGAGGAVGGAVARAFAREGTQLFLTGRHVAAVEVVAKEVVFAGGSAEAAEIDALDEQSVDSHLQFVIDKAAGLICAIRRARTSRHSRRRSASAGHSGDRNAQGGLRGSRQPIGNDLGRVPRGARKQDPHATSHDARGGGEHGRLPSFRSGEWDDGNNRQLDHGELGRLDVLESHSRPSCVRILCRPDPAGWSPGLRDVQRAAAAACRTAVSSRVRPYKPGGTPPARRQSNVNWPR